MKTHLCLLIPLLYSSCLHAEILPTNAVVAGKALGDWIVEYNRWLFTQPTNQSPALDTDGSRANNQNSGPVFLVAGGAYTGVQPVRRYTVPADKYLLIPLIAIQAENIDTVPPKSIEELRSIAAPLADSTELHLAIDGVAITNLFDHRAISPVYNILLESPDNLFSWFYGHEITGLIDPVIADGYWAMVEPLAPGTHTLVFGGTYAPPFYFSYKRTDIITVLPVAPSQRVQDLSIVVDESSLPRGRKRALVARLAKAQRAFERDQITDAIFQLSKFQHIVRQWLTNDLSISADYARRAQHIIDAAVQPIAPPNDSEIDGKSISEWSADWWKWQIPISTNNNPMLDTTGAFATIGQPDGSLFLLGGHLGLVPDTFSRSFSVPETKYLFGAVLPYEADNVDTIPAKSEQELRDQAKTFVDATTNLHVSLNGIEVQDLFSHRATSPVFNIVYTNADNVHTWAFGHEITGLIDPIVADGYWVMMEPLPPGRHLLRIDSYLSEGGYGVHLADTIDVTPVPLSQWLAEFTTSIEMSTVSASTKRVLLRKLAVATESFERNRHQAGIAHLRTLEHLIRARLAPNHPAFEVLIRRVARTTAKATREEGSG